MGRTSIPLEMSTRDLIRECGTKSDTWDELLLMMYKALGGNKVAVMKAIERYHKNHS